MGLAKYEICKISNQQLAEKQSEKWPRFRMVTTQEVSRLVCIPLQMIRNCTFFFDFSKEVIRLVCIPLQMYEIAFSFKIFHNRSKRAL
jgi:hypothetical protein